MYILAFFKKGKAYATSPKGSVKNILGNFSPVFLSVLFKKTHILFKKFSLETKPLSFKNKVHVTDTFVELHKDFLNVIMNMIIGIT